MHHHDICKKMIIFLIVIKLINVASFKNNCNIGAIRSKNHIWIIILISLIKLKISLHTSSNTIVLYSTVIINASFKEIVNLWAKSFDFFTSCSAKNNNGCKKLKLVIFPHTEKYFLHTINILINKIIFDSNIFYLNLDFMTIFQDLIFLYL